MRWRDLPPVSPVRALDTWARTERARGRLAAASVEAMAARARAGGAVPLVLVDGEAVEVATRYLAASALERGGLLVGVPVALDHPDGPVLLVHVRRIVPGGDDDATPLSLRLDASVWTRANASLGDDETVVGWFHSHPGLGAFFSDTDRRTQADFFPRAFSLGWVIDPRRGEHAWFVGPHSQAVPAGRVVVAPPTG
jgi:hypothetical protein